MTRMLVRVRDAAEAALASRDGVDVIELALDPSATDAWTMAEEIRARSTAVLRLRLSSPPGDAASERLAALGDVEVALSLGDPPNSSERAGTLPATIAAVAIVATTANVGDDLRAVRETFGAVMLEAGDGRRLIDEVGIARLDAFARACRAIDLRFGFAGGLEAPDVARLLLLRPDVLGFDRAVRRGHRPDGALDAHAIEAIRALIPRDVAGGAGLARGRRVSDRIFVRDFVLSLAIGAYQAEHGVRQRVRFGVEAEILREPAAPRDMRDVFSYDVIIETIRVLSERAHVTFVETLAEEVAAALLAHEELARVTVTVEKLDVIDGTVGIAITRERAR